MKSSSELLFRCANVTVVLSTLDILQQKNILFRVNNKDTNTIQSNDINVCFTISLRFMLLQLRQRKLRSIQTFKHHNKPVKQIFRLCNGTTQFSVLCLSRPISCILSMNNFVYFIDPQIYVLDLLCSFVHFIHSCMNPLPLTQFLWMLL